MILVKEEQEAWGLHGKHEEEAAASLGVLSSNSGGVEGRGVGGRCRTASPT